MIRRISPFILCFLVFAVAVPSAGAKSKTKVVSGLHRPGDVLSVPGGSEILLEGNRNLFWMGQGKLTVRDPAGNVQVQVDLQSIPQEEGGAEAMGLDVEETDLGGSDSSKKYLKGKKNPKGRKLDASKVGQAPAEKEKGQVTQSKAQGIPITLTRFPNGAYQLLFHWGKTEEEVYFDQRNTLISVEQRNQQGPFQFSLKQFADGSFTRRYQKGEGSVIYTFDAIDQSYRIVFANPKGEKVAEAYCDRTCSLE